MRTVMETNFTQEECKLIYFAVKYYQVHGASFSGPDQKLCNDILIKTSTSLYTQKREQPT